MIGQPIYAYAGLTVYEASSSCYGFRVKPKGFSTIGNKLLLIVVVVGSVLAY